MTNELKIPFGGPRPTRAQLDYHQDELAAFIHFGINTYYEQEWGNGNENPSRFCPTALDTDQWIRVLKETGFQRVIMVVKHHDGFVLYPSRWTDHTVAASPWRGGKGDLLAEISASASKYDMDLGIYLSPWDAHSPLYHIDTQDQYNQYYQRQLVEILSNPQYGNKGRFVEIWMDGARGEGAEELVYDYPAWFSTIAQYQPDALIFSTEATSIRWIGNEKGEAGDPLWQKIRPEKLSLHTDPAYLNHGDPDGTIYSLGEADVSIRSGWFYHEQQEPKSLADLLEIYLHSVGRGAPLLLNVPPNKEGLLADEDVQRLREFHQTLEELYATDLAQGARVSFKGQPIQELTDGQVRSHWLAPNDLEPLILEMDFGCEKVFDTIELREDLTQGQRVARFALQVEVDGVFQEYLSGQTIGFKRLLVGEVRQARRLRLILLDYQALPILSKWAVYKAPDVMHQRSSSSGLAFGQECYKVVGGQTVTVQVKRTDNLSQSEVVRLLTEPGTGVHGVAYLDQVVDISFASGETLKEIAVDTLAFSGSSLLDFYMKARRADGTSVVTRIQVNESNLLLK
ncbi:alpha-L-fucosidase [Streptococcus sp. DD13]|uniref:alpha-L-fucosidase n=1 Tax=Streptococcus sp. DD13 TaxID=1777881 RepID=UPI0007930DFA|nr:alpha-L-fucosidase [Streptococcus sp. DD13]KXT78951.1 glycosyl hydrolase family 29 (alpha-L-fucosidase) [Streptococcus sp. DD13]